MQQKEDQVLKKYHPSLCELFKLYRFFGLIHFDNYGRVNKKLRLYSIFNFLFQTLLLFTGFYLFWKFSYTRTNIETISKIPFFLQAASFTSNFVISAILFFRKNEILLKTFAKIETIGAMVITDEQQLRKNINSNRIVTFLFLLLLLVASVPMIETTASGLDVRVMVLMSFMLSFVVYLRELMFIVYMTSAKMVLEYMNERLRTNKPTVSIIKQLRFV